MSFIFGIADWLRPSPGFNHFLTDEAKSRKQEIRAEEYDETRLFTDPDPNRSQLCHECSHELNLLQSHPWLDEKRADKPFGLAIQEYSAAANRLKIYRQFRWLSSIPQSQMKQCPLCVMINNLLVTAIPANDKKFSDAYTYILKPARYGEIEDCDPRRSIGQVLPNRRMRHARWCVGIEVRDKEAKAVQFEITNAIFCAPRPLPDPVYEIRETLAFDHRPFMFGRKRDLVCDIGVLKMWPRMCSHYHGASCDRMAISHEGTIRLIDTKDNCIVSTLLSTSRQKDYVALSYVWGDQKLSYATAVKKYSSLFEKNSLLDLDLPKTISDAMVLVQKLGLRYLWVDALCIHQSDSLDKHNQIAEMGYVYQSAVFTIVAASGDNANAGLPGLRPGTRFKEQKSIQAGHLTLMDSVQYPRDEIVTPLTSKWACRGWTFQEDVLALRQLIFTDELIWWRCRCATWSEDLQLESNHSVGFLRAGKRVAPRLNEQYSILKPNDYFELVIGYAQRTLSYSSDGLNAFSGILSMLTQYSGEVFLWGLMNSRFQSQLHWYGKARKRLLKESEELPTWSWVSWEGQLSFDHHLTYYPTTACYIIKEDDFATPYVELCQPNIYESPLLLRSTPYKTKVELEDLQKVAIYQYLKPGFHLLFYSRVAKFYVTPQGRLTLPQLSVRYQYRADGQIIGPKPDYGYLLPSPEASELSEKGWYECIMLGRRPSRSEYDESHVVVMLITRDPVSQVAYRHGIADLPEDVWNLANSTEELIALG